MEEAIITVQHLTKRFGSRVGGPTAVDDISFTVNKGEIVGILGRNGAGKTTTISMLLGLLTPTSGTIHIFGKDIVTKREEILREVNFSSAYINFPPRLSVLENLTVFSLLYDIPNRQKRIAEVIRLFGIEDLAHRQYLYLSSGQETRVHLAKAFLNTPRILFLDEPTAALDPDVADSVRKLLISLQKRENMTVLLTSHNMAEVEEVCDRALFIDHGKLIAEDSPYALANRITQTTIHFLIKDGLKRTLAYCREHQFDATQEGRYLTVTLSDDEIVYFLTFLAERGITYQEISIDRPDLEDFFLEQTRRKA